MKLLDLLKRIGLNPEDDVDLTENETLEEKKGNNLILKNGEKDDKGEDLKTSEVPPSNEPAPEVKEVKQVLPKYDSKTGLFDLSGVEDGELKDLLKTANANTKAKAEQKIIEDAVSAKLGTLKIAKGISTDAVSKLLDRTGIKVVDGKAVGVDEAFDTLKGANAGLFVSESKEKSNPMLEGFNPQNNIGANALDEASIIEMAYGVE